MTAQSSALRNEAVILALRRPAAIAFGVVECCEPEGRIAVLIDDATRLSCDLLHGGIGVPDMSEGDEVLVAWTGGGRDAPRGVVLGRIGPGQPQARVTLQAAESFTVKCGESSLEMRADGQVLLKGDDVVIRAKGTQRIRAGNVAIN